ncbi:MAG: homocysteine methyltransferase [Ruminococcaceae bacterium]|nr:homocysteine methyltransferase [Oscillospiraceae bacterium]
MNIRDFIKENILFLDGGMGTLLQERGLAPGQYPESWNITHPDIIKDIHKSYFEAGSNVISTNTFGANLLKFTKIELEEIISSAIKIAKEAREESKTSHPKFIALDIGPCGKLLKPYGDMDFEDAVKLFSETVKIGVKYGVDIVFLETFSDSYETKAALLAVKESCDLPVFVSNAYGEDGKLMTGASPEVMIAMLEGMGADAVGANCSLGPDKLFDTVKRMVECSSVPVLVKPNAGLPKSVGGKSVYDISPEEFSLVMKDMVLSGVRIAGGCCGTTPEYISSLSKSLADVVPMEIRNKNTTVVSSYANTVVFDKKPVLIGERINPTGKKRFKQALIEKDISYILNEGISQEEKGVDILDVNVGIPDINEEEMLNCVIKELQAVSALPLQIDTSSYTAMEKALRCYNGKALINSVNGKEESMNAIFPLVKKYGGVVIALTLDENGIPETAKGRIEIAKRIIETAKNYGISKNDIVFDTLTMTVSANSNSPKVTLDALKYIKDVLGCHTSLGVSNVSFGLPNRDVINSTFFAMALENGLSAAIMNPHSEDMMKVYHSYKALRGLDENCGEYIDFISTLPEKTTVTDVKNEVQNKIDSNISPLKFAIVKGIKDDAYRLTSELLDSCVPLDLVNCDIIPALDIVGRGYENKTMYLPQLLMSAEAAKASFECIKSKIKSDNSSSKKCPFVIATVQGDIHDIGKNIVKLLLENYGFDVHDLGKDVAPEAILEEVIRLDAPLVGLSALMTTTVPAMEETIKLIKTKSPKTLVVVGGAVLTEEYAKNIGADKYAKDAMETVRFAEKVFNNK